jgi:NAD-dependent deacetylase
VMTAAEWGARTVELNLAASEITPLFDEVRHGPASLEVPAWVDEVVGALSDGRPS